jgi:hypothetical protein
MYSDRLLNRLLNEQRLQAVLFMPRRLLATLSRSLATLGRLPVSLSSSSGAWLARSLNRTQAGLCYPCKQGAKRLLSYRVRL